jgi:hypothetical protein
VDGESRNLHQPTPETIVRFVSDSTYELAQNAFFNDLFARRFGSTGICGGYGNFLPGASLPCHIPRDTSLSMQTRTNGRLALWLQATDSMRFSTNSLSTQKMFEVIPHNHAVEMSELLGT